MHHPPARQGRARPGLGRSPNLAAQRRQSCSATLAICSVAMPVRLFDVAFFSCPLWTCAPSQVSRLGSGGRGIRKGYHPVVCCSRIELGEHMPTRLGYSRESRSVHGTSARTLPSRCHGTEPGVWSMEQQVLVRVPAFSQTLD
ncbi:hypothetical protein J3F84DRAFT_377954 [Trichoderma pleuroticola]